MTKSRPHHEFRRAPPVLRRNTAHQVPQAGRVISARYFSVRRHYRGEIESLRPEDWSNFSRSRRWIEVVCPKYPALRPRCDVCRRGHHRPLRKQPGRGSKDHRLSNACAEHSIAGRMLLLWFPPTKESPPSEQERVAHRGKPSWLVHLDQRLDQGTSSKQTELLPKLPALRRRVDNAASAPLRGTVE